MTYAFIVAVLGVVVAIAHSLISEKVIVGPLYQERSDGVLAKPGMKNIVRLLMHLPSLVWSALGLAVLFNRFQGGPDLLPITAASIFAISGLGNLIALKRPHPGGIILLIMAGATLADIWFN